MSLLESFQETRYDAVMSLGLLLSLALAAPASQNPIVADDFNDGLIDPQWTVVFNPLQFWNVYEANGFFHFEGLTAPFGALQEQFVLEAGFAAPVAGSFALDFRLVWEEIASLPPGSGVTLTHVVLLDSGLGELARFGYEDVDEFGGGELVFQAGAQRVTVAQAAAGDATVQVLRDPSGMLHYSTTGSGGVASGPIGSAPGGVAFLRVQVEHSTMCGPCGPFLEPARWDWVEFGEPAGPLLTRSGACPGPVTLSVGGVTANAGVVLLHGSAGATTKPAGLCAGTTVALAQPRVAAMLTADAAGAASLTVNLPAGACGRTLQAVDAATCAVTNPLVL